MYYDRILKKLDRILKYLHSREIIDHYLVSMATKRMESPHEDITSILVSHNHTPIPALDNITILPDLFVVNNNAPVKGVQKLWGAMKIEGNVGVNSQTLCSLPRGGPRRHRGG